MALRAGSGAQSGLLERAAWKMRSSRRFFRVVAVVAGGTILAASLGAARVSQQNGRAVADARNHQRVASAITQFRNHLSLADAEVAESLVSGEHPSPLSQARYDGELLDANRSLTEAGLLAPSDCPSDRGGDGDVADDCPTDIIATDITRLAETLGRYGRLVQTGNLYPVDSTFADLAREQRVQLVPPAERVRRAAEEEVQSAADRVAGPTPWLATGGLGVALVVLVGASVVVAHRTHRVLHWALLGSTGLLGLLSLAAIHGFASQFFEMRDASRTEITAYVTANQATFGLLDLRAEEMGAVAAGRTEDEVAVELRGQADELLDPLERERDTEVSTGRLLQRVRTYVESIGASDDGEGNGGDDGAGRDEAVENPTLIGDSAVDFRAAREAAIGSVNRSEDELRTRLEAAADAGDPPGVSVDMPLLVVLLGVASAGLAVAGVVLRGWDHLTIGRR